MTIKKKSHLLLEQLEERIFLDANPVAADADITPDVINQSMDISPDETTAPDQDAEQQSSGEIEQDALDAPSTDTPESAEQGDASSDQAAAVQPDSEETAETEGVQDEVVSSPVQEDTQDAIEEQETISDSIEQNESADHTAEENTASEEIFDDDKGDSVQAESTAANNENTDTTQVVFIDGTISEYETLLNGVLEDIGGEADTDSSTNLYSATGIETVILDGSENEIKQITDVLESHDNLTGIHIYSHGSSNTLQLGSDTIDSESITSYTEDLEKWGQSLSEQGDILLYGCNVGQDTTGISFIKTMAELTNADVAASDDATGNSFSGGDWELEATTGVIETQPHKDATALWEGLLASPEPTSIGTVSDAEPMVNSTFIFSIVFDNDTSNDVATETGYGPYLDVVVPQEIVVQGSPTIYGSAITAQTFTYSGGQWFDGSNNVVTEHPGQTTGSITAGTILDLPTGSEGDTWYYLEQPFGSFTTGQPAVEVVFEATASTSDGAVVGTGYDISYRAGFTYGDTADNQHGPLQEGASQTLTVTPQVIDIEKTNDAPEEQTVTGPNYPVTYTLTVNVAAGENVSDVVVSDYLPEGAVYRGDVTVTPVNGASAVSATVNAEPVEFTVLGSTGSERLLSISLGDLQGVASADGGTSEYQITYSVYFADTDSGGSSLLPVTGSDVGDVLNEASVTGTYNNTAVSDGSDSPLGALNDADNDTPSDNQIEIASIVTYKDVSVVGGGDPVPGATLEYQIEVDISDYYEASGVQITDILGDGQSFDASFTPTITVHENGSTNTYTFTLNTDYTLGTKYDADDVGGTELSFDISALLASVSGDGALTGAGYADDPDGADTSGDPFNVRNYSDATYITVTFRTTIDDEYGEFHNSPQGTGDASIDVQDSITNQVDVSADITDGFTTHTQTDDSGTSITIGEADTAKTVYAVNGNLVNQADHTYTDSEGQVHDLDEEGITPGDLVTYRLTLDISLADFENLVITDFLPLPVYSVSEFTGSAADFDGNVDFTAGEVEFLLPSHNLSEADIDGLVHNGSSLAEGSGPVAPTVTTDFVNNSISFDFGSYDAPITSSQPVTIDLLLTATITDEPMVDGLHLTNQAEWTFNNTTSTVAEEDQIVQLTLDQPVLEIQKGVVDVIDADDSYGTFSGNANVDIYFDDAATGYLFTANGGVVTSDWLDANSIDTDLSNVDAGDIVTYAVVIENTGHAAAYDITLNDVLPTGYTTADISNFSITDGLGNEVDTSTSSDVVADYFGAGLSISQYDKDNNGTADDGDGLGAIDGDPGENIILVTYNLTIHDDVGPDQNLDNTASVLSYAGSEGGASHPAEADTASVDISDVTVDKVVLPADGTIGDQVQYTLTVSLPEGAAQDFTLTDDVVAGLEILSLDSISVDDPTGLSIANAGIAGDGSITMNSGVSITTSTETDGNDDVLQIQFGDITNTPDSGTKTFTITYTALIRDIIGNDQGDTLANNVTLHWLDENNTPQTSADSTDVTVLEAQIVTDKLIENSDNILGSVEAGNTIDYSFRLTNQGNSTAYETTAVDTLPQGVSYDSGSMTVIYHDTGSGTSTDITAQSQAVLDAGNGTVTFSSTDTDSWDIAQGDYIEVQYTISVLSTAVIGDLHTNTVDADWTSLDGTDTNERLYDDRPGRLVDQDLDTDSSTFEMGVVLSKTNDQVDGEATIGDIITYTIEIDVPQGQLNSFSITDALPEGMSFVAGSDTVTSSFTDPDPTGTVDTSSGHAEITWSFGDFNVDSNDSITITYQARVDNILSNSDGLTQTNTATAGFINTGGQTIAVTDTSSYDIVEPVIDTTKVISDTADGATADVQVGDVVEYQVTLENTGEATAFEVTADDQPADGVTYIQGTYQGITYTPTATLNGSNVSLDISERGGVLSMTNGSDGWDIDSGQTLTITYFALVGPSYFSSDNTNSSTNTVDADWSSQDGTTTGERIYDDGDSQQVWTVDGSQDTDTADFSVDYTGSIGDLVFYDADNSGNVTSDDVGIQGVEVVLTADLDGDGTSDFTRTTTTADDGSYIFTGLAGFSDYEITVDPTYTTLPDGLSETYDLDGGNDSTRSVSLAEGQHLVTVDFGYTGSGSIGDTVWYDTNQNGLQDETGMGISGAQVTLQGDFDGDGVYEYTTTVTTDADGSYQFDNLPFSEYVISVTSMPNGLTDQTADPDAVLDSQHTLTLTSQNAHVDDVDFGYVGTGSIGDTVWLNTDGDSNYDSNETGLGNVTVILEGDLNGDGISETLTTVTDGNGQYQFTGLGVGAYTITVDTSTLPGGLTAGDANYDLDNTPDNATTVNLAAGENLSTADFGYLDPTAVTPGEIGDRVWLDLDGDGIQDGGSEIGITGVTVNLLDSNGTVIDTAVTDSAGDYLFTGLAGGTYTVQVDDTTLPGNAACTYDYQGTADGEAQVTLTPGTSNYNLDFGYRGYTGTGTELGRIGDTIWLDLNGNNIEEVGSGDVGLANVDVTLLVDLNDDAVIDTTLTTTTDENGFYIFTFLPAGSYTVIMDTSDLPDGVSLIADPDGGNDNQSTILLDETHLYDLDQDFGYAGTGTIGDQVWENSNGNNLLDGAETGLAGVTLELTGDLNNDGVVDASEVLTTITDANGRYQFSGLPAGDYTIEVVSGLPAGYVPNYDGDGGLDQVTAVSLGAGETISTIDFGFIDSSGSDIGSIGDTIWLDVDGDGVQDGGNEIGIGKVTVELHHSDGTVQTTTTDSNGQYYFGGLSDGDYTVVVDTTTLPQGMYQTFDLDTASGGTLDNATQVTLSADSNIRDDLDFGYRGQGSVGDTIWLDLNGDGNPDIGNGDFGLANVDVSLSLDVDGDGTMDITVTTTTDSQGRYLFQGLPYEAYTISIDTADLPAGVTQAVDPDAAMDNSSTVTLTAEHPSNMSQDFGYRGTGSIGQLVWNNLDGDNQLETADGESGIPGVTVILSGDFNNDGVISASEQLQVSTDALGQYLFDGLAEGAYTVTVDTTTLPDNMQLNYDPDTIANNATTVQLTAVAMTSNEANFGYQTVGTIGDTIWYDYDGDGVQDAGEIGLSGVTVMLTDSSGNTTLTSTDSNGHYSFTNLNADTYTVTVDTDTLPTGGLAPSGDLDGLSTPNTASILLAEGDSNFAVDFGYTGTGSIGDTLWNDVNGNGVQDGGEEGFFGVEVIVGIDLDGDGQADFSAITVTDSNGHYLFDHLPQGYHTISVNPETLPEGAELSTDPDGTMDNTTTVQLEAGENIDTIDFGYQFPETLTEEGGAPDGGVTPIPQDAPVSGGSGVPFEGGGLEADAFLMHRQFGENLTAFQWEHRSEEIYVTPPVPIHPVYSGMAEPGTTLSLTLYDAMGNRIGFQTIMADTAGNWLASFPATTMYDVPHHMVIDTDDSSYNASSPGMFNLRTYFHPSLSSMMFSGSRLDVESIFAYLPSTILASMHSSNVHLTGLEWNDFNGYEFHATSINPAKLGR